MKSYLNLNVNSINNFFELVGNLDETKVDDDNNLSDLSDLFDKKLNKNLEIKNNNDYLIRNIRKLQKMTLDIKVYLKANENEKDSIDFEKVYLAATKIGLIMNTFQGSLNLVGLQYCHESFNNMAEILSMEKKQEKGMKAIEQDFQVVDLEYEEAEQINSDSNKSSSDESSPRSSTIYSSFSSLLAWLKTPSSSSPVSVPSTPILIESKEEEIKRKEFEDGLEVLNISADLNELLKARRKLRPEKLREEILSLLSDQYISKIVKYFPYLNNEYYLECPKLFIDDAHRISFISYNGDNFYKIIENIAYLSEDVKKKLGNSNNLPKSNLQFILEHLIDVLGQKLFNKVGAIIHQSHTSNLIIPITLSLHTKILDRNEQNGFETRTSQKFDIFHDEQNNTITIVARVIYETSILQNGKSKKLGFFGVRREITASITDLINEENPSTLEVKEYISDLETTIKKVEDPLSLKIK